MKYIPQIICAAGVLTESFHGSSNMTDVIFLAALCICWQISRLEVVNLFGYRSTNPDILATMSRETAVGHDNDQYILNSVSQARLVLAAWGNRGSLFGRDKEVKKLIGSRTTLYALKINVKSKQPAHPLYLKANSQLVALP